MVDIFKALSEQNRLRILSLLLENELCVCEIIECLKMTQTNVSRHLTALRKCGILENYKQAQWTYYKINKEFIIDNEELWSYLNKNLKELPSYTEDREAYRKCKAQDLCNCIKNTH